MVVNGQNEIEMLPISSVRQSIERRWWMVNGGGQTNQEMLPISFHVSSFVF